MSSPTRTTAHHYVDFPGFLANTLHVGTKLCVYHVSTPPTSASPIFAAAPGQPDEFTTCESHFLTVSQRHSPDFANLPGDTTAAKSSDQATKIDQEVLVLGIEVLIFSTDKLNTIFVSKADSTGLLTRRKVASQPSPSIIKNVITAFLEWLAAGKLVSIPTITSGPQRDTDEDHAAGTFSNVDKNERLQSPDGASATQQLPKSQQPGRKRLILSLFARSQNQYLFPGSIENETKHVLDDRQLIKWWCRLLDGLVQRTWPVNGENGKAIRAQGSGRIEDQNRVTAVVSDPQNPRAVGSGADDDRNHGFSVPPTFSDAVSNDTTSESRPQSTSDTDIVISPSAYVIVPGCDHSETIRSFFPPSARTPNQTTSARWHNSFPVEQLTACSPFHDSPSTEPPTSLPISCLIPRLPDDPKARYCKDLDDAGRDESTGEWRSVRSLPQFWESMEYRQECSAGRVVGFVWVVFDPKAGKSLPLGNAVQEQREVGDLGMAKNGYIEATDVHLPPQAPSSVTLTSEQYNELSDFLINDADFAGIEVAAKSTREWAEKVKELAQVPLFGINVEGRVPIAHQAQAGLGMSVSRDVAKADDAAPVNVLMGVRKKKRKLGDEAEGSKPAISETHEFITHSTDNNEGGQTLSAGLIRKKPKP